MNPRHPARRRAQRTVGAIAAGGLVLALAACGDDSNDAGAPLDTVPVPGPTTAPPSTSPTTPPTSTPSAGIEHPVGADDVVLRIAYEGGYVPVEVAFQNLPTILVTGDGRVFVQGPQLAIYPGPLLPNVLVRTISEDGIQQLLALAADHGLLTDREYENPTNIADAPDTVVTINANGDTYEHRAYALGLDAESDELRQELTDFVEAANAWMTPDNPELGPEQPFVPEQYLVRAIQVDDLTVYEPAPTVEEWPAGLPALADATDCLAMPAADVGELFAEANQLTFFTSADVTYQLAVTPQLPGTGC